MSHEPTREEKAFEALIVQSLTQAEAEEVRIAQIREPNEKERAALRMVKQGFLERLVRGDVVASREESEEDENAFAGGIAGDALYRCKGVAEDTEKKLADADREIIERRKKKRNA